MKEMGIVFYSRSENTIPLPERGFVRITCVMMERICAAFLGLYRGVTTRDGSNDDVLYSSQVNSS